MPPTPNHIFFIIDGNRRWAQLHKLSQALCHKAAFDTVFRRVITAAVLEGIPYITIWMASQTNLVKRSAEEVRLGTEYIAQGLAHPDLLKLCTVHKIRVTCVGPRHLFKHDTIVSRMKQLEAATKHHTAYHLTLLVPYDGKSEMLNAIKKIQKQKLPVTERSLRAALWTGDLPDVDLMIRTGDGDAHLSTGSLMWLMANTQLYFPHVLWPDFNAKKLAEALREYRRRTRRLGA